MSKNGSVATTWVHTLVIGSGAAGLNAAVQLRANGVENVLILTEGLDKGTSINTGSDKQTYYKLSLCGAEPDSVHAMAETYFGSGSMHGDLALVEASLSARAFSHLVNLGMPFPRDSYGQFVGYKTDHDPRQRATSIGPYTSREMCRTLARCVETLGIPVCEGRSVIRLLTVSQDGQQRAAGVLAIREDGGLEAYGAENVVFAVGGPGGLYKTSVYPPEHTGSIGLALQAGCLAQNLPESQYGLASTRFRWNVSGTYMQAIPRFISLDHEGVEREFLRDYFASPGEMNSAVFLKGYQWPFDARKVIGGSSLIDILVTIENVVKGRRVYLDFRTDPADFRSTELNPEATDYLRRSGALLETPLARLGHMNPSAIDLYADHGIDLTNEPLDVAICVQHNNGGLASNLWWESINVKHLFPVGEVNGSHGIYRPGGSALNAGQVGGFRAAEYIANRYMQWSISKEMVRQAVDAAVQDVHAWTARCESAANTWQSERAQMQERMTRAGAHVRSSQVLAGAVADAWAQLRRLEKSGCCFHGSQELAMALCNRQLCFAHAVYLEAIAFALASGVGSRGSAVALEEHGIAIHDRLGDEWRIAPEDGSFREQVLETVVAPDGQVENRWVPRRPIPQPDAWFETTWAAYRNGEIY